MSINIPVWGHAEQSALSLPTLEGDAVADACVIGLGGSGLACIRELVGAGMTVIGIDAHSVAAGAAGRNGGFLLGGLAMFHHDAVEQLGESAAAALYRATLVQIERMIAETPDAVRRTGSLRIAVSDEELSDCREQFAAMRRTGLPVEEYDGPQGRGLLFPSDASFDPAARCRALAEDALSAGAQLFEQSRAVSISANDVRTEHGRIHARHIVVAVDGGLEVIFPELLGRVRSARLQMLATEPDSSIHWPRPVYARGGLDYWQQLPDKRVVLGGYRDVGGEGEWTTERDPTEPVQEAMTRLLRELGVQAPVTHRWAATVGYSNDGLPILEQPRAGVWAIGGYSGTGNVVGALCARAVVELITDGKSDIADLLRPR